MNTITNLQSIRVANTVRILLAAIHKYSDITTNFGKAVLDILKKQYPGQDIDIPPGKIGQRMFNIAKGELQRNPEDALDLVQEFLTYLTTGTERPVAEEGESVEEIRNKPWNFAKDFTDWREALRAIYGNLRRRGISRSRTKFIKENIPKTDPETGKPILDERGNPVMVEKQRQKQKSIDDAFGKRTEGGPRERGEERVPTPQEFPIGQALDDRTAIKEFLNVIDDLIPDLKQDRGFTIAEDVLFNVIFEDGVGSFSSDIKENMGQSTAFKEKLQEMAGNPNNPNSAAAQAVLDRYGKRWSGFVTDTRKEILRKIEQYVEYSMTKQDFNTLWDMFHDDIVPSKVVSEGKTKKSFDLSAIAYKIAFVS